MASEIRKRGFPLFATLLIALGALLLLQTTGVVQWDAWWTVWRLWPVLVIVLGINIAFGNRMPWLAGTLMALVLAAAVAIGFAVSSSYVTGVESVTSLEEPLDGVERLDLVMDLGAGTLSVGSLPDDSPSLVEGDLRSFGISEVQTSVTRSGDYAELVLSTNGVSIDFFGNPDRRWDVRLSPTPSISIDLDTGASNLTLDLTNLNVSDLTVRGGATDIEILAPRNAGHVNISVGVGAANVDVAIPELVAARIDADLGFSGLSVDEGRFPKVGNVYESIDFDTSENRINLEIDAGASSVDVR